MPGTAAAKVFQFSVDVQDNTKGGYAANSDLLDVPYLGFRHIRTDFNCGPPDGCNGVQDFITNTWIPLFQQTGITSITQPNCPNSDLAGSIPFLTAVADRWANSGALYALGGCNEPNNQHYTYNGLGCFNNGTAKGCRNFENDLYAAYQADPVLKKYPVYTQPEAGGAEPDNVGMQFIVDPATGKTGATHVDLHNYVKPGNTLGAGKMQGPFEINFGSSDDPMGGEYCGTTFGQGFPATAFGAPCAAIPTVSTEIDVAGGQDGITDGQRGVLLSNLMMIGTEREAIVSLYALKDDGTFDGHWLFFNGSDGGAQDAPTHAATALHNLTTVLMAGADPTGQFTPSCVMPTVTGLLSTDHTTLLQTKANGLCELVITSDEQNNPHTATLSVTGAVYDPTSGSTASLGNSNTVQLESSVTLPGDATPTAFGRPIVVEF